MADLPERVATAGVNVSDSIEVGQRVSLHRLEVEHIRRVLNTTANLEEAARILEIDPSTLYRKRSNTAFSPLKGYSPSGMQDGAVAASGQRENFSSGKDLATTRFLYLWISQSHRGDVCHVRIVHSAGRDAEYLATCTTRARIQRNPRADAIALKLLIAGTYGSCESAAFDLLFVCLGDSGGMMFKTLQAKLLFGLTPLLLVMVGLGIWATVMFSRLGGKIDVILKENYRSVLAAEGMKEALERMDSAMLFAIGGEEEQAHSQFAENQPVFERNLKIEQGNVTLPGEQEMVRRLDHLSERY